MKKDKDTALSPAGTWTFLTNYSHVLICLHREPTVRLREIAEQVGITERAVQRIVQELEEAGVITRHREGRRNRYEIRAKRHLRHPLEGNCSVGDLLRMVDRATGKPKKVKRDKPA